MGTAMLCNIRHMETGMSKGASGRVVVEIDRGLKQDLYVELARSGLTMKEWFIGQARRYLDAARQPHLFDTAGREVGAVLVERAHDADVLTGGAGFPDHSAAARQNQESVDPPLDRVVAP